MNIPQGKKNNMEDSHHFLISVFDVEKSDFLSKWIVDKYPAIANVKPLKQKTKHCRVFKYVTEEYTIIVYKPRKEKN